MCYYSLTIFMQLIHLLATAILNFELSGSIHFSLRRALGGDWWSFDPSWTSVCRSRAVLSDSLITTMLNKLGGFVGFLSWHAVPLLRMINIMRTFNLLHYIIEPCSVAIIIGIFWFTYCNNSWIGGLCWLIAVCSNVLLLIIFHL